MTNGFVNTKPSHYGICLFDGRVPGPGWMAIDGGPARRIEGPGDLNTGTLWWVNLTYDECRDTGLLLNPWIRHSGFLRASMDALVDDLGLVPAPPSQRSQELSGYFERLMRMVARAGVVPRAASLTHDLAQVFPPAAFPSDDIEQPCRHAYQDWTRTHVRPPGAGVTVALHFPRIPYAWRQLQIPVPDAACGWTFVPPSSLPPGRDRLSWISRLQVPSLVKVRLNRIQPEVSDIFAFGTGARDNDSSLLRRQWMSEPEAMALIALTDTGDTEIVIEGVWLANRSCPQTPPPAFDFLWNDPAFAASWSAGVLAENLWVAACAREKVAPRSGRTQRVSFRAVWARAVDRVRLCQVALALRAKGWAVLNYGVGALRVSITPDAKNELLADALALGLVPPLSLTLGSIDQAPLEWGGEDLAVTEALLRAHGNAAALRKLDTLHLLSPREQAEVLHSIEGLE